MRLLPSPHSALPCRAKRFTRLSSAAPPFLAAAALLCSPPAPADSPQGMTGGDHISAYTPQQGELRLSGERLKINTDIDFLDLRDDMVADSSRLTGDSGDLDGFSGELELGVTPWFSLFYREQQQDLTLRLVEPGSVDLRDVDSKLETRWRRYGLKWNLYEAGYRDRSRPWRALSLELTRSESRSEPFGARVEEIRINANARVNFNPPQRFAVDQMKDEGWQGRMIYSQPLSNRSHASIWAGYARLNASAGTSSDIDTRFVREAVDQRIDLEQTQVLAGISLNWSIRPWLPLQIGYEYIHTIQQDSVVRASDSPSILPSFLRIDDLTSMDENHVIYGNLSYWITPQLHAGINGRLYSNQFHGVMPHFNNPLSSSFADTTYGYAGFRIGYHFDLMDL